MTLEAGEPKQSQQPKNKAPITKDPAPPLAHEVLGAPHPDTECLPLHQMPFWGGEEKQEEDASNLSFKAFFPRKAEHSLKALFKCSNQTFTQTKLDI